MNLHVYIIIKKSYEEYQETLNNSGNDRIEELPNMLEEMISFAKLKYNDLYDVKYVKN